jgi:hypothetical protein
MLDRPARHDIGTAAPAAGIAPLLNAFNPAMACMELWNGSVYRLTAEATQSWLNFLSTRWVKDLRLPQEVSACKSAEDLRVTLTEFWQQASTDYATEFHELSDLAMTAMDPAAEDGAGCASKGGTECCGKCTSSHL